MYIEKCANIIPSASLVPSSNMTTYSPGTRVGDFSARSGAVCEGVKVYDLQLASYCVLPIDWAAAHATSAASRAAAFILRDRELH